MSANPIDHPELYDSIVVAGKRSPGVVKLTGHDRNIEWDIKDGPGQEGATMTRKGGKPAEFTATFYLADDEDFGAWPAFAEELNATVSGATPKAKDVYHPDLARNDIKSIVLKSMGGVIHDGKGGQTIVVKLTEYRPPKPKGGAVKPKDPNADLQSEIAKLTAQYQATPWGAPPPKPGEEQTH